MIDEKKSISFAIEKFDFVDENPSSMFSLVKIQAFASGGNLHAMDCSENVLRETAVTIFNKPILYTFIPYLNDFGSHAEPDKTLICGACIPDSAEFVRLDDGRLALFVMARLFKRYVPKVMEILQRNDGTTKVSVEMDLLDSELRDDGITQMNYFEYSGVSLLGQTIQEANIGSHLEVLSFSKENEEFKQAYQKEFGFKYDSIDFSIPENVKKNANQGLSEAKKHNQGNAVALATARHLVKNDKSNPDKVRHIAKFFKSHKSDFAKNSNISFMLYGGKEGFDWSKELNDKLEELDNKQISYFDVVTFPYTKAEDMNPALKGITPEITLEQGNSIARQADAIGADKGGWGIAIKSFKDHHLVKDGKWIKKEKMSEENLGSEESKKEDNLDEEKKEEEKMAVEPKDEKNEKPADEKAETPEKEKSEQEKGTEEKMAADDKPEEPAKNEEDDKEPDKEDMAMDENLKIPAMLQMLEDQGDDFQELANEYHANKTVNYAKMCGGMYAKMCKMAEEKAKFDEEFKAYMSELEGLRKFKADVESRQFAFEVETTLKDVVDTMPKDKMDEAREDSKNFSLETVDAWKNKVKAIAFTFSKGKKVENDVVRIGLNYIPDHKEQKNTGLWIK